MKCLIIDKVYAGIAEELSKYMEVKTAENLPSTKDQLLAEIGDVDVLIMRVDPKIDQEIIDADQQRNHGQVPELKGNCGPGYRLQCSRL